MYETHFGLRQRPFRCTPDTACYYPATTHELALSQLLQALAEEEGLVLLGGAPGSGKTLLCHCLLARLPETRSAFVTNTHLPDRKALLQAILFELGLPHGGVSEQELRLELTEDLLERCAEGQTTVLIVDESQHLTLDLLEELRLLSNLESGQGRALQVVLSTQPTLQDTLARPEMTSLRQRLAVQAQLEPLSLAEAADYLLHHLRAAGGQPEKIVGEEALEILARGTRGVPRLLNQATHRALTLTHLAGASIVDVEAALEALTSLGLESVSSEDLEEANRGNEPCAA